MKNKKRIITRIAILLVPVVMAALHYFFLAPYLHSLGNKTADQYEHAITLVIFGALIAAIAALLED